MLIALLLALGVDLIVVVVFAAFVLGRRQWLKRQPGEFAGAIRVPSGEAPLMFRNELVPVDRVCGDRPAHAGGVKRIGDKPVVIEFASDGVKIEIATRARHRALAAGPLSVDVT